ncbi:MAG TPA: hypothetical protein VLJ37_09265 [bacterium]|nr:hypothetical protein [bacterium]
MISMKRQWLARTLLLALGVLAIGGLFAGGSSGCGDSGGGGGGSGLGGATTVTGTALAANGTDPIAGATVFIPGTPTALTVAGGKSIVQATCDGAVVECDDPPVGSCASVCTCADGTYTLDTSACPADSTTIRYCKGSFCGEATLDCADNPDACTANIVGSTASGSTANIAVVTGSFDEIQNVLAKLGFGTVNEFGELELGTESFDLYDGDGSLGGTYPDSSALFGSLSAMQAYDIIFINCGTNEDPAAALALQALVAEVGPEAAHTAYHVAGLKAVSTDLASRIRSYIEGGGTIFATDLAYDYVEQSVPEFMNFEGDGTDVATAETPDIAQTGTSGIVSNATVMDGTMSSWLEGRSSNTIDTADSPGNSCTTTVNGSSTSLLDPSADTIRIGDFLAGWGVMEGKHSGIGSETFVWIQGPVDFTDPDDFSAQNGVVRPLTATRRVGSGCVLYSSYHTSHSCATEGFWPQERVLQYLVFETAGRCVP